MALETLQTLQPGVQPRYLMIECAPVSVRGNTLRRHWLVSFERGGQHYFFADSKRPGHIAGPYASVQAFVDEYARYRGRRVVIFSERASYENVFTISQGSRSGLVGMGCKARCAVASPAIHKRRN
ncbi:hypothetical protein, partial [Paracidovorax sp. MALMAid1276]|uniref:hypothetical protein n=1 Tax=Paracidovorax sp. MALMAid1276 TaxID=3411631 RepID=UPI003B9FED90